MNVPNTSRREMVNATLQVDYQVRPTVESFQPNRPSVNIPVVVGGQSVGEAHFARGGVSASGWHEGSALRKLLLRMSVTILTHPAELSAPCFAGMPNIFAWLISPGRLNNHHEVIPGNEAP
jgi:hypothetical protein